MSRWATACWTVVSASTRPARAAVGGGGRDEAAAATDLRACRALLSGAGARQPGGHPGRCLRRPPGPGRRHRLEPGRVRRCRCSRRNAARAPTTTSQPPRLCGPAARGLRWAVHDAARRTPGSAPGDPGGPPVWVGGHSDPALRRALRFGDGWYGSGVDAAEVTDVRRRLYELAVDSGDAGRLTLASAAFLTPPGIPAAVPSPGRPLGGPAPTAASVVDDLGRLAEAGLTACTVWLPVAADHVQKSMEWIAAEVMPQLA